MQRNGSYLLIEKAADADAEAANILTNMIEEDESHHINIDMAL